MIRMASADGLFNEGLAWPMWQRLQRWCTHQFKRWSWGFLGAALGGAGVCWFANDVVSAHEQAEQAVQKVQEALAQLLAPPAAPPAPVNLSAHAAGALWARLTHQRPQGVWTGLQQALGAQGVQVVSIRVLPDVASGPLPSQSAALRVNAPYPDWVKAWRTLSASGPVLSIERMSVVPHIPSQGAQIDVVLRHWFKPGSDPGPAAPDLLADGVTAARSALGPSTGADIFGSLASATAPAPLTPQMAQADGALLPADPQRWPLARIRLLGTWQQGGQWRAVLSAGELWVSVRAGQRISQEGHRVMAIQRDAVTLRSAQGEHMDLNWPGGAR